ncbi:MAG TPA: ABC transporter permease [Chloroflexota bacterium]|nr:ABC transporter permease [Chloroflexota bacterium]
MATREMARQPDVARAEADGGVRMERGAALRSALRLGVWQVTFGLAVLALWEWASGRLLDTFFVSKPSLVAGFLWQSVLNGTLARDVGVTMRETAAGYLLGAPLAILCGFLLAQAPRAAAVLNPYILAVYGVPRIALAPLFLVWFGIGENSKVFLALMMTFFLTFVNTFTGINTVDMGLKNVARVMGASGTQVFWKVVLPAASPWIIAGLRVSIPQALVAAVVGELVMSTAGLGYRIGLSTQTFNITGAMSGVLVLMLIVILLNLALDRVEAYLLRWRPPSELAADRS